MTGSRDGRRRLLGALLGSGLVLAACSDTGTSAVPPVGPPATVTSELNPAPLPVGWLLSESRERCQIADGLLLHRIRRGSASQEPAPLPCTDVVQENQFGGGSLGSVFATGPYAFHVLEIDPDRFTGQLEPALAQGRIAGKATTSEMADAAGAIAAINAGFFVVGPGGTSSRDPDQGDDGLAGDPAGVTVLQGELVSEAVGSREALVFSAAGRDVRFPRTETRLWLEAGGESWALDGINRVPGAIRNCGGTGGDSPTESARHDVTCSDPAELIWFSTDWGLDTPAVDGLELVLDAQGRVMHTRPAGGSLPAGGSVIAATGDRVVELQRAASAVGPVLMRAEVYMDGEPVTLVPELSILNGGPGLVRDGEALLTDNEGGFRHPGDPIFGLTWVDGPNPRTMIGRTASGRLLLVVCDGRQPDWSVGLPLRDAVRVMRHLGAVDAMALDGGGSSTLVVNGQVVNSPSDGAERPVSDALLLIAR